MAATTTSQIVWPRPAVAGCIFCTIVRDTRGVALDQTQRFNFFPASPLCSVAWQFAGDCHLIDRPDKMERPRTGARLPDLAVFGPQLGPGSISRSQKVSRCIQLLILLTPPETPTDCG